MGSVQVDSQPISGKTMHKQGEWLQSQTFSPRKNGSETHIRLPSPEVLDWEEKTAEYFCLKGQWDLLLRDPEGCGKQTPLLKGAHKISHALGPRAEAVIWKEPESDSTADLRGPPGQTGGNWSSPGNIDTGGSHFGEHILPHGHWFWLPFWSLPSTLLALGPSPTH